MSAFFANLFEETRAKRGNEEISVHLEEEKMREGYVVCMCVCKNIAMRDDRKKDSLYPGNLITGA